MFWNLNSINEAVFAKEKELQAEFQLQQKEAERREGKLRDELAGLKPFLNTHDDADSSELSLLVDTVNDLLHDFASAVSDDVSIWSSLPKGDILSHKQCQETLRRCIPQNLLEVIVTHKSSTISRHSTTLFMYGIHASFLQTITTLMGKFCYGLDDGLDREMQNLANETLEREIQPVYGRWRSITHASIRRRHPSLQLEEQAKFKKHHSQEIALSVFYVACLTFQRSISQESYTSFYSAKEVEIMEIMGRVADLCIAVRERVISRDYHPYLGIGDRFNSHLHELPFPVRGKLQDDETVCCIRLGLTYRGKKARENGKIEVKLWKKPHVITKSMLMDIISDDSEGRRTRSKPPVVSPKQPAIARSRSKSRGSRETPPHDPRPAPSSAEQAATAPTATPSVSSTTSEPEVS